METIAITTLIAIILWQAWRDRILTNIIESQQKTLDRIYQQNMIEKTWELKKLAADIQNPNVARLAAFEEYVKNGGEIDE